ncbi:hypothetical protein GIB67_024157 [Kingdonia uniflora]|uniref:Sodium/calcium exchanger membrane region domain-containing protein n=1 Tax=Kingdonia uniflora TaxID=39325 RepID=A0A7J7LZG7_9MAGN|nr:hypothetical protein GIB67_024157 [Kingdonia uniflora]
MDIHAKFIMKKVKMYKWTPPPKGTLMLNSYGSVKEERVTYQEMYDLKRGLEHCIQLGQQMIHLGRPTRVQIDWLQTVTFSNLPEEFIVFIERDAKGDWCIRIWCNWQPPDAGYMLLDSTDNSEGGYGGVIRDHVDVGTCAVCNNGKKKLVSINHHEQSLQLPNYNLATLTLQNQNVPNFPIKGLAEFRKTELQRLHPSNSHDGLFWGGFWYSYGYLCVFYLLDDTASVYFCSSLESLSSLLNLSPTIVGVTLLSFGNGAPDVLATIVSFQGSRAKGVGFNSVLGGATFVSCVVVGVISITMDSQRIVVYKLDFVRDVCFFFLGLSVLLLIMVFGKINLWGALGFTSLYFVYILVVYITHSRWKIDRESELGIPILCSIKNGREKDAGISVLCSRDNESEVIIIDREVLKANGYKEIGENKCFGSKSRVIFANMLYILEFPLYLPRRLTIPIVSEERWCKPFAIALCYYQKESSKTILILFVSGGVVGVVLGILTFVTTQRSSPPKKFLLPWLVGGFLMSVSWSYLTTQELVALLVSCGYILGISPSILGHQREYF